MISLSELDEMRDKDYRHGLVSAQMDIDLPLEIRALRKQRGWSQPELAKKSEMKQPRISAMEKPGGANFTLETLKRLARAFDVALIVRFAPFSELLDWSDKFSPDEFSVSSFDKEAAALERTARESKARAEREQEFRNKCANIWQHIAKKKLDPLSERFVDSLTDRQGHPPSWITRDYNRVFNEVSEELYPPEADIATNGKPDNVVSIGAYTRTRIERIPVQQETMDFGYVEPLQVNK